MSRPGLLAVAALAVLAFSARAQPGDVSAALLRMDESLAALDSYAAEIHRTSTVTDGTTQATAEAVFEFAVARPNRVSSICEAPEGRRVVVCDGERLVVWSQAEGVTVDIAAPSTLAEIDAASGGLAAEGLAIAGLFLSEEPLVDLTADFEEVHDIGRGDLEGRMEVRQCRLIGLDSTLGPRMIVWIDEATGLPCQALLDASSTLRDWATAADLRSQGLQVTVTETHREVRVNPTDLDFRAAFLDTATGVSRGDEPHGHRGTETLSHERRRKNTKSEQIFPSGLSCDPVLKKSLG